MVSAMAAVLSATAVAVVDSLESLEGHTPSSDDRVDVDDNLVGNAPSKMVLELVSQVAKKSLFRYINVKSVPHFFYVSYI